MQSHPSTAHAHLHFRPATIGTSALLSPTTNLLRRSTSRLSAGTLQAVDRPGRLRGLSSQYPLADEPLRISLWSFPTQEMPIRFDAIEFAGAACEADGCTLRRPFLSQ